MFSATEKFQSRNDGNCNLRAALAEVHKSKYFLLSKNICVTIYLAPRSTFGLRYFRSPLSSVPKNVLGITRNSNTKTRRRRIFHLVVQIMPYSFLRPVHAGLKRTGNRPVPEQTWTRFYGVALENQHIVDAKKMKID